MTYWLLISLDGLLLVKRWPAGRWWVWLRAGIWKGLTDWVEKGSQEFHSLFFSSQLLFNCSPSGTVHLPISFIVPNGARVYPDHHHSCIFKVSRVDTGLRLASPICEKLTFKFLHKYRSPFTMVIHVPTEIITQILDADDLSRHTLTQLALVNKTFLYPVRPRLYTSIDLSS